MTSRVAFAALAAAFVCAGLQAQNPPQQGQSPASATAKSLAASWGIFVYPTKNQTKEQQDKDEYECYQWAKQQTGIDLLAPAPAATAEGQPQAKSDENKGRDRSAVRGAARGAAAGAAVGEVADDDAGGGAKKGAAVGALRARRERMAKAKAEQEAQAEAKHQAEAQAATADEKKKSTFNKAFSACLEGRSYTVK
jgi:hypothetical protein